MHTCLAPCVMEAHSVWAGGEGMVIIRHLQVRLGG